MHMRFTIHKLQGTTVEGPLCMDLGREGIFLPFQAYVAASRIKTRNDMYLLDLEPGSFTVDARVANSEVAVPGSDIPQSNLFFSWESFFGAPAPSVMLTQSCRVTAPTNFRLDSKSWIIVRETQPEKSWRLSRSDNLEIQATQLLRTNRVDAVPSWHIGVDSHDTLLIAEDQTTPIILHFNSTFFVHFIDFTFFLKRVIGINKQNN